MFFFLGKNKKKSSLLQFLLLVIFLTNFSKATMQSSKIDDLQANWDEKKTAINNHIHNTIFINSTILDYIHESLSYGIVVECKNNNNQFNSMGYKIRNQCFLITLDACYMAPYFTRNNYDLISKQKINFCYGISANYVLVYCGFSCTYMHTSAKIIQPNNEGQTNFQALKYHNKLAFKNRLTPFLLKRHEINDNDMKNQYFNNLQVLCGCYVFLKLFEDVVRVGMNFAFYSDFSLSISPQIVLCLEKRISNNRCEMNLKEYDELKLDEEEKQSNKKLEANMDLAQNL
jgi:hypothetical protein